MARPACACACECVFRFHFVANTNTVARQKRDSVRESAREKGLHERERASE